MKTKPSKNSLHLATIASLAPKLASGLAEQGWTGDGSGYDLGAFPGDADALAEEIGHAPTFEERLALEKAIRQELDRLAEAA